MDDLLRVLAMPYSLVTHEWAKLAGDMALDMGFRHYEPEKYRMYDPMSPAKSVGFNLTTTQIGVYKDTFISYLRVDPINDGTAHYSYFKAINEALYAEKHFPSFIRMWNQSFPARYLRHEILINERGESVFTGTLFLRTDDSTTVEGSLQGDGIKISSFNDNHNEIDLKIRFLSAKRDVLKAWEIEAKRCSFTLNSDCVAQFGG